MSSVPNASRADARISRVGTRELLGLLSDPRLQLVDARPIDAYNGWPLAGEAAGGHIPGARTLPRKWLGYLDWPEIVRAKGLAPERPVVVYAYEDEEAEAVARAFLRCGYGQVALYAHFLDEWCADGRPLAALPRWRHLVPASWLREVLGRGEGPGYRGGVVVCHTHYRRTDDYARGHIPGALDLDTNTLESTETWNRREPGEVRAVLEALGIARDSTVVLYGRCSSPDSRDPFPGSSAGQIAAFRCAWLLLWAGVQDVRVLNGGIQSWLDAGYPLSTQATSPRPVADFGGDIPGVPGLAVDLPEARALLAAEDANLVCVRSWREYTGEVSGYHYIERKGRIPGAVFADCGTDAYHMENYRNLDHTCREYGEVEAAWRGAGITADKHNAFYCGTGWRGSEAFFNAWLLGWPRVSVYDGGWYEWSRDPANPVETGVPHAV